MEGPTTVSETIPDALDFNFCPVNETTKRTFTVINVQRKASTTISVKNDSPFIITPAMVTLPPRGKAEISIEYMPREAKVVVASVVFNVEGESQKVTKISAIGKFSYITLNKDTFQFGEHLIGQSDTMNLIIKNQSLVSTTFRLVEEEDFSRALGYEFSDSAFSFDVSTGNIPAGGSFLVKIKFTPSVVYMLSSKNYIITTDSGNSQRFTCLGSAVGLQVALSSKVCNFGEVKSGNSTSRIITVDNSSNLPCSYKFFVDKRSVFSFKKTEGNIPGRSSERIIIYFTPKETISYYLRVFCLVRNHTMLYLDLLGTCYDIMYRPVPLSQRDIEQFRNAVLLGTLGRIIEQSQGLMSLPPESYAISLDLPGEDSNQISIHKEMFQSLKERLVSVSEEFVDFGFCMIGRSSESRNVSLTNNLSYDVYVIWLVPGEKILKSEEHQAFSVKPVSCYIPVGTSQTFQFVFNPNEHTAYYFNQMQCQIFVKRQGQNGIDELGRISTSQTIGQTGALAQSRTHLSAIGMLALPPLSFTLPLIGHSFPSNIQTYIPMVRASPKGTIKFPPCAPGDSIYQSVQVINSTDTPCYFKIVTKDTTVFRVAPVVGFIEAKSFVILAIEFRPTAPGNYNYTIQCILNHSSSHILRIPLSGVCCGPTLIIDNEAKIFYPPLFTGVASKQKIGILNSSHIALDFDIDVPEKYREELSVEPRMGAMYPHEKAYIDFSFTPLQEREYRFNVPIRVRKVIDSSQDANYIGYYLPGSGKLMHRVRQDLQEKIYYVTIYGSGGQGRIDMNPKKLDFDTVSVGFSSVKSFTLSNISNCAIFVKLTIIPKDAKHVGDPFFQEVISSSFSFDFKEGILAANSNQKVNLRFVPNCRSMNEYYIQCLAKQTFPNSMPIEVPLSEEARIILSAHGDFPVITILDVRNKLLSPAQLWRQFDLDNTISAILSPLSPLEIKFNNAEIAQTQAQGKLSRFDWDFGKLIMTPRAEARKIVLTLKNIGGVGATFKFVSPSDNELEMEAWADPGDPSPEEAFEKRILEQKIFVINPKEATLECNETYDVELYYNPVEIGQHHLNILFQIVHGKPIVLTLRGETLPSKKGYLELRKDVFEFDPLPIGSRVGITQPIEIRNLADAKVSYSVDLSSLDAYTKENYSFPIFEVQNPEGVVEPGDLTYLYCNFKPLETKEYSFTLPIIVKDRNSVIQTLRLTLKGSGYHPKFSFPEKLPTIFDNLPSARQSFSAKSSNAGFSTEEIDFGVVQNGKPSNRLAVIYNRDQHSELKFSFKSTQLVCGDDLLINPIQGTIAPGSFLPIKFTLNAMSIPTSYEGELECYIEWDLSTKPLKTISSKKSFEIKPESATYESIFLRIKKRADLEYSQHCMEISNTEPELIKNILRETIQTILSEDSFYKLLEDFDSQPIPIMDQLDNDFPPFISNLYGTYDIPDTEETPATYSKDRLFLMEEFLDIGSEILENTVFNVICESIYGESDLCGSSKTYYLKNN